MKVNKLPKDPGPAAWNAILPPAPRYPALEGAKTVEWLVIGAGWAGLAAARRLKQLRPQDRIAVLEARRIAEGPNGRNSGFMIDLPHSLSSEGYAGQLEKDRRETEMNRLAIDFALEAVEEFGLPQEACVRTGKINAAATERGLAHNQDYASHLEAMGEAHEILDAQELREITGSPYYLGAVRTPLAAMTQPALYIRGVAQGLAKAGVGVYEDSPVQALERRDGDWRAETPGGRITAPKVILAVNGHAESFGFFRRRLMHLFTYASMTRALTTEEVKALGGAPNWGVLPADPQGTTVRRVAGVGGDRIVIRNRFSYHPSMEVSEARVTAVGRDHDKAFAARFPMLKGVEMQYRWGGRLCLAKNGVAGFKEVEEGLVTACVQNGLGTSKGTLAGKTAADYLAGANSSLAEELLAQPLPEKLPPEPLAYIGANAFIRWGEMKAGKER